MSDLAPSTLLVNGKTGSGSAPAKVVQGEDDAREERRYM